MGSNPGLRNIKVGFFRCKGLESSGVEILSESLSEMKNLEDLMLYVIECRKIEDECLKTVAWCLFELPKLENVVLDFSLCEGIRAEEFVVFNEILSSLKANVKTNSNLLWMNYEEVYY